MRLPRVAGYHLAMFSSPLRLTRPGLFITATDTGVGKTLITCAVAAVLRRQQPGWRVGVAKPMASGCRRDREGLVSEDAEAIAHFADCRDSLSIINPVRYAPPVAPAVAAEMTGNPVDFDAIAHSLTQLDQSNDCLLIEGVGGLLVPIDGRKPQVTLLDLIVAVGYPVLVVTRAGLGTLNHTAMTVRLLQAAGCRVAGLALNGFRTDDWSVAQGRAAQQAAARGSLSGQTMAELAQDEPAADVSMASNRLWLQKMTRLPLLAVTPLCPPAEVQLSQGLMPEAILEAVALTYWPDVLREPRPPEV